jgi:hypothetical protein
MKRQDDRTMREASRRLLMAAQVQLASSLISNSTAAMLAENRVRELSGGTPAFSADAFWSEIRSIYDQLGLPHDEGAILLWQLFDQ